jgi:hypothetical protein
MSPPDPFLPSAAAISVAASPSAGVNRSLRVRFISFTRTGAYRVRRSETYA